MRTGELRKRRRGRLGGGGMINTPCSGLFVERETTYSRDLQTDFFALQRVEAELVLDRIPKSGPIGAHETPLHKH